MKARYLTVPAVLTLFVVSIFPRPEKPESAAQPTVLKRSADQPSRDVTVPIPATSSKDSSAAKLKNRPVAKQQVLPETAPLSPLVELREARAWERQRLAARAKLRPRRELSVSRIMRPVRGNLVVSLKMRDQLLAQADGADGISLLDSPAAQAFSRFVEKHELRFVPVINQPAGNLEALEDRAAGNSGIAQPVLQSLFFVRLADGTRSRAGP